MEFLGRKWVYRLLHSPVLPVQTSLLGRIQSSTTGSTPSNQLSCCRFALTALIIATTIGIGSATFNFPTAQNKLQEPIRSSHWSELGLLPCSRIDIDLQTSYQHRQPHQLPCALGSSRAWTCLGTYDTSSALIALHGINRTYDPSPSFRLLAGRRDGRRCCERCQDRCGVSGLAWHTNEDTCCTKTYISTADASFSVEVQP